MKKIVAVIGDANIDNDPAKYQIAFETGKLLVDNGYRVKSGGLRGVMKAVFEGAKASSNYKEGDTIAILPGFDKYVANEYVDIAIPTGLDLMRNVIVANSDAVIAIGGGAGTLSEMASAWALKRFLLAYDSVEGWSKKLAGTKLDDRVRFNGLEDQVWAISTPESMIKFLNENIDKYQTKYEVIKP